MKKSLQFFAKRSVHILIHLFAYGCSLICISLIWLYQRAISPLLGHSCRFYPTCSQYTLEAIKKYGFLKGCWLGMKRIAKCGPWHKGGVDLIDNNYQK